MTAFARAFGAPPILMILTWVAFVALHRYGPIDYFRQPTATTWGLIAAGIVLFSVSSLLSPALPLRRAPEVSQVTIDRVIILFGVTGLVGILALIVDKVFFSGLDYSQGLTAIRFTRDIQVAVGIEINRTILLYIGYLTFSTAYIATILYLLSAEHAGRWASVVGKTSIASPVAYALLYGGRAPILLLCVLILAASMVRAMSGRTFLTRGVRLGVVALFAAFLAYVNATWQDRREYSRSSDYQSFLDVAAQSWQLQPAPWLDTAVRRGDIDADTAMNSVSILLYITHSAGALDKIVEHNQSFSPFFGVFQVGVLSPLLRVFFPKSDHLARMHQQLGDTELFGWFVSAWGALFLDFGLWGAIGSIAVWGLLAGRAYHSYAQHRDIRSGLLLTFWASSIIVSPLNSPIGMANSVLILGALLVALPLLRGHSRSAGRMA